MARIRTIKPDFFLDEDVAALNPLTRLLYISLWCLADKAGRLEDRPQRIKIQSLPYDKIDVNAELDVLVERGFIIRYAADDMKLIEIRSFLKHQRPHNTEKESDFPPFSGEITVKQPLNNVYETTGKERKGKERKGTQGRFVKPNLADVKNYCKERKNNVDPQKWFDHYESNGWRVGRNAMIDWKASIRTWEKSAYGGNGNEQRFGNKVGYRVQPESSPVPEYKGDGPALTDEQRQEGLRRIADLTAGIGKGTSDTGDKHGSHIHDGG